MNRITRLALSNEEIHLWLAFYEDIRDERLIGLYRRLLSPSEVERQSRFRSPRDRHRYLVTRALVRTVLSRYESVSPEEWRFATNAYGRPSIVNATTTSRLSFNISHSEGLILLGVTRNRDLGVDTENLAARDPPLEIASSYFSPEECTALCAHSGEAQCELFFEYWTLKESYIKARGLGLSVPLSQLTFRLSRNRKISVTFAPELADDPAAWRFWLFRPAQQYIAAVCVSNAGQIAPMVLRRSVPLERDEQLPFSSFAAS